MTNPQWTKWTEHKNSAFNSVTGEEQPLDENETLYANGLFHVLLKVLQPNAGLAGALWLSIRRNDRKAIRDWRHFQRIKNELAGAEREGIEIFPPESSLVDGANQYHLWILPEGESTPFTWNQGRLVDNVANHVGAVQRPYEEDEVV